MFDDSFKPDFDQGERPDDVSLDDAQVKPLSWKYSDIDNQVGDKGWQNKFTIRMIVQVALSIFYAIVYGLSFIGLHPYYEWPLDSSSTTSRTTTGSVQVGVISALTDEEYFTCQDKTFFLNETGPLMNYDEESILYDDGIYDVLKNMGIYWGISIAFFVAFVISRLYSGRYNQLLLVVKFKLSENDAVVKPIKLSFAYTLMCNAKSFSNVVFMDLCDRMAYYASVDTAQGFAEWLSFIFVFFWLVMMLWILWWIFSCGQCCGLLAKCDTPCFPSERAIFRSFRFLVICNTLIMLLTWIVNLDPSIEFNLDYPMLFIANVVSWIDLAVSIIGDVYLHFLDCKSRK
jgi:hypothetical protein